MGLSDQNAAEIRQAYVAGGGEVSQATLARRYGVSREAARRILKNESHHDPKYTPVSFTRATTPETVDAIRELRQKHMSYRAIATELGVTEAVARHVGNNETHPDPDYAPPVVAAVNVEKQQLERLKVALECSGSLSQAAVIAAMSYYTARALAERYGLRPKQIVTQRRLTLDDRRMIYELQEAGFGLRTIAREIGCSVPTAWKWMKATATPTLEDPRGYVNALREVLDLDALYASPTTCVNGHVLDGSSTYSRPDGSRACRACRAAARRRYAVKRVAIRLGSPLKF